MTGVRCVHGLDSRFCSICNRPGAAGPRGSIAATTLPAILAFLNAEQIRATTGAVGEALGVSPRLIETRLGPRSMDASWIVNAETGLPTGYGQNDMHPALLDKSDIISSGIELVMRLSAWKAKAKS
jgi:hypothetical protein